MQSFFTVIGSFGMFFKWIHLHIKTHRHIIFNIFLLIQSTKIHYLFILIVRGIIYIVTAHIIYQATQKRYMNWFLFLVFTISENLLYQCWVCSLVLLFISYFLLPIFWKLVLIFLWSIVCFSFLLFVDIIYIIQTILKHKVTQGGEWLGTFWCLQFRWFYCISV